MSSIIIIPQIKLVSTSAVAVPHTGDTAVTILRTVAIPAKTLGLNGFLRVSSLWSLTNSVNTKAMYTYFGAAGAGLGGTLYGQPTATTAASWRDQRIIQNVNAANSQKGFGGSGVFAASGAAIPTSAVDTTAASEIVFACLLANSGETISLEAYLIEALNP